MSEWQQMCASCRNGRHVGGCCGCMACRVVPEPVERVLSLDELEAKARQAIAKAAAITVRGWNGRREKVAELQRVDYALDAYNLERKVIEFNASLVEEA